MRISLGRRIVTVLVVLAVGIGLGGCAADGNAATARLVVRQNGRDLAGFTMSQLQNLPQVEIATPQSQGSQVQRGATVRSVLDAAGASDVVAVRVEGRDPAQTLTAAELTDQVVLSVTKRDTLKMSGTGLDRGRWVRDVTALVVNP